MTSVNPKIFKAYDVRGIYPTELNEEIAYRIGRAFAVHTKLKKVIIGRDMRISSPSLQREIIKGLLDQGVDVEDIGMVSTDTFYFVLNNYDYSGGIMVTASHNPKEYGGCKMFGPSQLQIYSERGMTEIKNLVLENNFKAAGKKGRLSKKEKIVKEYAEFCLGKIDYIKPEKILPFSIVLDAGSGMASSYLNEVLAVLPIQAIKLYFEPDGNFPDHEPNPIKPENTIKIQELVKKEKADFGFSFDGDADRILLIDEKGQRVDNDILLVLIGRWFLKKYPGSVIVKQIVCSKGVDETIAAAGGKTVVAKVGTAFIKEAMKKNNAIFAGEISGHFYFKDFWLFDSGLLIFLTVLQVLSELNQPVSETVLAIDKYFRSGEINSEVSDQSARIEEIKKIHSDGKVDLLDGLTVYYQNWWFNVRPSNTEPLLRLNVEANSRDLMEKKRDELLKIIRE